ncbi:MAG: hypothetical protein FWE92_05780 [Defluviitaleaceae bacterium]|nr:hypothetical protein [Defluviitaleaceae bacterium]
MYETLAITSIAYSGFACKGFTIKDKKAQKPIWFQTLKNKDTVTSRGNAKGAWQPWRFVYGKPVRSTTFAQRKRIGIFTKKPETILVSDF